MVSAFKMVGVGCNIFLFIVVTVACGLPMFSVIKQPLSPAGDSKYEILLGQGLFGVGQTCNKAAYDDFKTQCDTITTYTLWTDLLNVSYTDLPSWLIGAGVVACLTSFLTFVNIFVSGCCSTGVGAGLCGLCAILAIVPFALWEDNVCQTGLDDDGLEVSDCGRSWSYGLQCVAFVFLLLNTIFLACAHKQDSGI